MPPEGAAQKEIGAGVRVIRGGAGAGAEGEAGGGDDGPEYKINSRNSSPPTPMFMLRFFTAALLLL